MLAAPALADEPAQPDVAPPSAQPVILTAQAKQEPVAQNSLYVELGGQSLLYSINYERFVRPDVAIRVGLSYMSVTASASNGMSTDSANATWATLPVMGEYLGIHSGGHALELGAGLDIMYMSGKASTIDATANFTGVTAIPTATIGYRYSDPAGGFVFRAGYTPLFVVTGQDKTVISWAGTSLGYRF